MRVRHTFKVLPNAEGDKLWSQITFRSYAITLSFFVGLDPKFIPFHVPLLPTNRVTALTGPQIFCPARNRGGEERRKVVLSERVTLVSQCDFLSY